MKGFSLAVIAIICATGNSLSQNPKSINSATSESRVVVDTIHALTLEDNFLGDSPNRAVSIYLPPGYFDSPKREYPVLYFLHSFYVDHTAFFGGYPWNNVDFKTICDGLISSGKMDPIIVVSPNSFNKFGGSMYTNSIATGMWADFIVKDVVNYIENNFNVLKQKESRGLAGHSMGGTGTIWLIMNHPDIFNAAYMLSGWFDYSEKCLEFKDEIIEAAKATNLDKEPWLVMAQIAEAAAYAPDTLAPPSYAQFPYNGSGEFIDTVFQKWLQHDPVYLVPAFKDSLMKLSALQFDCGQNDYLSLITGNEKLSNSLSDNGIVHTFKKYQGDHSNKLAERIETKLLPFFSDNLAFTLVSNVESAISPGFKVYPNPIHDYTHIKIPETGHWNLSVISLTGQFIASYEFEEITYKLDLSTLEKGVYSITLRSKDYVWTRKVIKL